MIRFAARRAWSGAARGGGRDGGTGRIAGVGVGRERAQLHPVEAKRLQPVTNHVKLIFYSWRPHAGHKSLILLDRGEGFAKM